MFSWIISSFWPFFGSSQHRYRLWVISRPWRPEHRELIDWQPDLNQSGRHNAWGYEEVKVNDEVQDLLWRKLLPGAPWPLENTLRYSDLTRSRTSSWNKSEEQVLLAPFQPLFDSGFIHLLHAFLYSFYKHLEKKMKLKAVVRIRHRYRRFKVTRTESPD